MSTSTASCLSREKAKEAVVYVIETVLEFTPLATCPLWLALVHDVTEESRVSIYNQWLWLTKDEIAKLEYKPDATKQKVVPLARGYHTHITRFQAMYNDLRTNPAWTDMDIFNITPEEYMKFSRKYMAGMVSSNPLSPPPDPGNNYNDPVAMFTKSIKREPKDFPNLKTLAGWDTFKRAVHATAIVQSIAEVLDSTHVPSSGEQDLFNLKNSYWYKVLIDIIQESSLRAIVNAGPVGDGQTVWKNIVTEAEKSTTARISSQTLTAYLTTSKIRDGTWKGTDTGYLNHWNEQMRKLVEYSPTTPMTDEFKLSLLKNAVQEAPHLASVESAYDINTRLGSGSPGAIDYNGYLEVLLSAAQSHDARISPATRAQTRRANLHSSFPTESYDDEQYDIDTSIDTILANAHNTMSAHYSNGTRVPDDAWSKLPQDSRNIWMSIPIDDRKLILGASDSVSSITDTSSSASSRNGLGRGRQTFARNRDKRKVMFTDQLSEDNTTATEPTADSTTDDTDLLDGVMDHFDIDFDTLCVHVAERKKEDLKAAGKHPHFQPAKRTAKPTSAPPGDVRRLLSDKVKTIDGTAYEVKRAGTSPAPTDVTIDDVTYSVKMADCVYRVSTNNHSEATGALVDRGANGGIAGSDCRVIEVNDQPQRYVNVEGIDGHVMERRRLVSAGAVAQSNRGPVILIMNQYAHSGKGHSIHSSPQLEWNGVDVDEKSARVGGKQRLVTFDGFSIPINIRRGLPYIDMRPHTDQEWEELPHVLITDDAPWDPKSMDHEQGDDPAWYESQEDPPLLNSEFDLCGDYRHRIAYKSDRILVHESDVFFDAQEDEAFVDARSDEDDDPDADVEEATDRCVFRANTHRYVYNADQDNEEDTRPCHHGPRVTSDEPRDYEALRPRFAWLPADIVKKTFEVTTQYARMPLNTILRKRFKSPNPAVNVRRRDEPVATDTIQSDVPAIDGGEKYAQIFVGTQSLVTDVHGMKSPAQFPGVLTDEIINRGAPTKLISDSAKVETSKEVRNILRTYGIASWQSEPYQQHQNPAERRYQTVKRLCNTILDRTGAPAYCWLLCLMYVCYVLNNSFSATIKSTPLRQAYGTDNDISPMLYFSFYEPVYYLVDETTFPSESKELRGRWVGVSENVGHFMTYKILTDDTRRIIHRSNIRSASDPHSRNLRLDLLNDEPPEVIRSLRKSSPTSDHGEDFSLHDTVPTDENSSEGPTSTGDTVIVDPQELMGRTFLMDTQEDGQKFRARIVECITKHESDVRRSDEHVQFRISVNEDEYEEIITYNELMDFIQKNAENDEVIWRFRRIVGHQGPLLRHDKDYKGSRFNVLVEWENGEITSEPLSVIAADDPVTCAVYAREHDLLDVEGWKRFRNLAKREKHFLRLVKQAKLKSYRQAPKYKFGYRIPRDYEEALKFDEINQNTKWQDATDIEMGQLNEYEAFIDAGIYGRDKPPEGYKKIRAHLVFDVKHDGRHKARYVAGGHLTDVPTESVYSGVVSLRGLRMVTFLSELNDLELWATDVGNAYLEARTAELLFIVAGPEFGDLEGHMLVIYKALYGLRSSGLRWHERFSACLRDMGFFPCKAEPDIWMKPADDHYEYISVFVDDLTISSKDPQTIVDTLMTKYSFKLKGTGPISYHLGMTFHRNERNELCISPQRYIEKMVDTYKRIFGESPSHRSSSPLESNDHPEIDTSEFLGEEDIQKYQSLIGAMQWAISIGRFDIGVQVMTMSSFRGSPRQGHLERAKRMVGYLSKFRLAELRVLTDEPDFSDIEVAEYDWSKSIYGDVKEVIPTDAPKPLGKPVTTTSYQDANLYHDIITGRSVTAVLHFLNKFPVDWYTKKQATVETATYGSEYISARTCVDQIVDLRTTLRYLGVPVREVSYMFGDNESVVNSSIQPHSKLHKRHNALSYHRVREAIASGYVVLTYLPGKYNPADILSKHWAHQAIWPILKPILFFHGDTASLIQEDDAV